MKPSRCVLPAVLSLGALLAVAAPGQAQPTTQPALVAAYGSLADAIVGTKAAEKQLVLAILAATHEQAAVVETRARAALQSGGAATADLQTLAALVSQLATEGDAAVGAVRKRLLEQGHHHHSSGEQQGVYEEGYVVVTREAKKALMAAATEIGKLATAPGASGVAGLDAQWQAVEGLYGHLTSGGQH